MSRSLLISLFLWLGGAMFIIPAIFVSRFFTFPALWAAGGLLILITIAIFRSQRITISRPVRIYSLAGIILILTHGIRGYENFAMLLVFIAGTLIWWENQKNTRQNLTSVYRLFTLPGAILALWGWGQFYGWLPCYDSYHPVTGSFDNPSGFSTMLAALLPFALYGIARKNCWLKVTTVLLMAGAIVISGSRSGMLAASIILLLFVIRRARRFSPLFRQKKVRVITVFALTIGLLLPVLYLQKKDSADGRLLIWQVSLRMIAEKPLAGHGASAFQGNYMPHQAAYFMEYPESRFAPLADNVKHPFNEYLKLGVEYGLPGCILLLVLLFGTGYEIKKNMNSKKYPALDSLIAVGICSCFTYSFSYPAVWVLVACCTGILLWTPHPRKQWILTGWKKNSILILITGMGILVYLYGKAEYDWNKAAQASLKGETQAMLSEYARLRPFMKHDGLFLYNYGAELNEAGYWEQSAQILEECSVAFNDIDVQLLLADNYKQLGNETAEERCLLMAANMCPVRFLPLYHLVRLYDRQGKTAEAHRIAAQLLRKPVKIPSPAISYIQQEMKDYLSE